VIESWPLFEFAFFRYFVIPAVVQKHKISH